ncbi:MAG: biotin/lipoyl-containing protein [Cyclobacteriaceae bacterium]
MEALIGDKKISVEIEDGKINLSGDVINPDISHTGENRFNVINNHKVYEVEIVKSENKLYEIKVNGTSYPVLLRDKLDMNLEKMGISQKSGDANSEIKAPMPGLIIDVLARTGDEVKKGDPILILEAMKMENVIKSPIDGKIEEVFVSQGESVEKNKILCRF